MRRGDAGAVRGRASATGGVAARLGGGEHGPRRRDERWGECNRGSAERAEEQRKASAPRPEVGGTEASAVARVAGEGRAELQWQARGAPQSALGGRM